MNAKPSTVTELQDLRQEIRRYRIVVDDPELRAAISSFLEDTRGGDVLTPHAYLKRWFTSLRQEYEMKFMPSLHTGAEAFPDECAGCEHYGNACPWFTRRIRRSRKRRLASADSRQERREVWEDLAVETGCHRVPEKLQEWEEQQQPEVERGERLLEKIEDLTLPEAGNETGVPEELQRESGADEFLDSDGADAHDDDGGAGGLF